MYRTKQQVDKHTANILGRIKDENERNSRGYQFAKLYCEIQEYDVAKRYLAGFMNVRDNYAPAHKLMGQIQEGLDNVDMAIIAYKRSLDFDERQRDVVIQICQLYCKTTVDPDRAKYWAERGERMWPGHPAVFKLREKAVGKNEGQNGTEDLETLITSELVKQPKNPELRAKLLRMYIDTGRINEAYTHAVEVENKKAYPTSLPWCSVLLEVFEAYQKQSGNTVNGSFHQHLLTVHARLIALTLETSKIAEVADALYKFDQCLATVTKPGAPVSGPAWDTFCLLIQAQFYSFCGHLLLKRAQQDHLSWSDATNMAALCYLASYSVAPPNLQTAWVVKATEDEKARYAEWHDQASFRRSEAGHLLMSLCGGDGAKWASKIHAQWASQVGRSKMYDSLFTMRHMKGTKDVSFLMTNDLVTAFKPAVPSEHQLREMDKVAHLYRPSQLRNLVWLALHAHQTTDDLQPDYGFKVFHELQYETATALDTASPETLSQLDTQAFLYAVVHNSALHLGERQKRLRMSESQPRLLPLCFKENLCTTEQAEWWETAYMLHNNKAREELGRLRLILQRGIEAVRLIGNHGMPVSLVVHLARVFTSRAQAAISVASVVYEGYLQERAALYWTAAVEMLERLAKNQTVWSPKKRLFSNVGPALTNAQIQSALEEGRLFLAVHAMHSGKQEEAIEMFGKLSSADASFHQAQIYRMMAAEAERPDDDQDSPQVALLTKARDALYLTMDRIRGQRHHNLTPLLPTEIDDVESKLNRLVSGASSHNDSVITYQEEVDGLPEPSRSILQGAGSSFINTSTPQRPSASRSSPMEQIHHTRPSPERLDAQMRSLTMSQELLIKQLMEQNEELKKQNRMFSEEIGKNKEEIEKLKTKVESSAAAGVLIPPPPMPLPPGSPAMHPGIDRALRPPMPGGMPSPYYSGYRPHEYDYAGAPPHPPPPLAAYSPHPHGYPLYGPPPPLPPHYPYPPPPAQAPPQPAVAKPTIPKVPAQGGAAPAAGTAGQDEEDEEQYYIYDEDEYCEEDEDTEQTATLAAAQDKQMPRPGAGGPGAGSFHIPDSQLIQDWPYGNSVNLEGKSTLTYSPTHPMQPPGYFPQMPPPAAARQPLPPPAMYGSPVVPPPAIGPGFFSSPERPAYGQRFQSPTHLAMPNSQAAAMVGLAGQPAALTPPKPGFLPPATVQPTTTGAAVKMPPPNASLTATGGVINPASMAVTPSTAAAALTGGTIFKMNAGQATPDTATATSTATAENFGTKFIMTMPPGSSSEPKPPASLSSPAFTFGLSDGTNPSNIDYPEEEEDDTLAGDDCYQGPDFEPIIPLPDEVEVVTGEEEESILFNSRSKLFRFTEGQWKERGLGEIKILHHKASGRVRIVMRREQVHKVCANHSLSPEMTINFKSPTEKKVLTWQAMDFAEGESQMEQLCAKFKSEDIALQFKEKFEEGVKLSAQKKPSGADKPAAKSDAPKSGLFDKFKPKTGSWDCDTCMINNTADVKKCVACNTPKPGASPEKDEGPKLSFPASGGFSFGGAAGAGAASGGGFTFGGTGGASSSFGFGSSTSSLAVGGTSTPASTTLPKVASAPQFGTPASSGTGFSFGGSGTGGVSGTPKFSFGTPSAAPASENKPAIVFGNSGTPSTTDTSSNVPAISPPKLNIGSTPASTTKSTAESTTKPLFSFGNSSLSGGTFKFGESKPAEGTSTPASDMLKNIAAQSKPTDIPKPKATENQIGGFTFTSTPVVAEKEKAVPQKEEEKKKPEEPKTASPFAGFSFGSNQKTNTPTFGAAPSLGGLGTATSSATPTFGSVSTSATPTFGSVSTSSTPTFGSVGTSSTPTFGSTVSSGKSPDKAFGSDSTAASQTFGAIAGTDNAKPEAFAKKTDFKGFSGAGQQLFSSPKKNEEGGTDEEYEPDVEFKPIIPLPDLVTVETGEENEAKLFNSRVRLFRHDQDTKQWKERGIGEIKILKHKETNRCRLLMRREQVLKICCNQIISPSVKLQKMATSDKAWCWVTQDFSEGETKMEQFACKFKSPEIAQQFKEVYDEAAALPVKEPVAAKPKDKPVDKSQPSLKEMFKLKAGAWQCDVCLVNNAGSEICSACQTPKPGCNPPAPAQPVASSHGFKFGSGGGFSFGKKDEAQETPKADNKSSEAAAKPQHQSLKDLLASNDDTSSTKTGSEVSSTTSGGFSFGSPGGFTFGKTSDKKDTTASPAGQFTFTPSRPASEIVFGKSTENATPQKSQGFTFTPTKTADSAVSSTTGSGFVFGKENSDTSFSFGGVTPSKPLDLSATKSPKSPTGEDFYVNTDGEDSHIFFEPIVQLEKVEVKTGEEEEEVLYSHRAKLFRFVETEWKERGLGDVKILMHKETKKRRIIMRREQVHKICMNHYVTPELSLVPMNNAQGKAWVWHAEDFVDGDSSHEKLAIRFKTKETADEFKEAFVNAQEEMKNYSTPTKAEDKAKSDLVKKDTQKTGAKQSLTDKFATKQGEWDCKACLVRNKADSTSCLACATAREGVQSSQVSSTESKQQTPSFGGTPSFGSFSFKSPTQSDNSTPATGFSFGSTTPTFGAAKGFSFGTAGMATGSIFGKTADSSGTTKNTSLLATMLQEPTDKDSGDDDDIEIVMEKKATPEQIEKARKLMLPDHFYLYEEKPPCPGCLGCDDGEGKMIKKKDDDVIYVGEVEPTAVQKAKAKGLQLPPHFYTYEDKPDCTGCVGCEQEASYQSLGQKKTEKQAVTETAEADSTTSESLVFGQGKKEAEFSFSAIASGNAPATFGANKDSDKPFSWQGAGASLFQSPGQRGGGDDEDEDGVPQSGDIHFEPLVNLPEVEVKTGEEEEDVLYSHRSKLFRFDNTLNQWKERGIGEIKLLQHRETKKIRVLMRREQVLKLAANHMLTADMKLTPLQTSETAWCWFALDIAEGEPRHEHLAIKFKTKEIAEGFKTKFEECQAMLGQSSDAAGGDNNSRSARNKAESPSKAEEAAEAESPVKGEAAVPDAEAAQPGEEDDDAEYEDEEEEDEDLRPLFAKRATMMYANGDEWKSAGMGELEVSYDDDVNGARITMSTDEGVLVCNHIICREYSVQCNESKKFCEWTAKDFSTDDPVKRTFRVQFSSKVAVQEFRKIFQEGRELAVDSEISEVPDHVLASREIIPQAACPSSGARN